MNRLRGRPVMLLLITLIGLALVLPLTTAQSVVQQSSSNAEQHIQVHGGTTHVQQESTVRSQTNDAVVEQHAELNATKQDGTPAQVHKSVTRHVVNPNNESITVNTDQNVSDGAHSLTTTQGISQAIPQYQNSLTPARSDAVNATASTAASSPSKASAETNTDVGINPLRSGGSFTILVQAFKSVGGLITNLLGL